MIVLIGFMGAGKTTVGSLIADLLDLPFFDSDREIEQRSGKSVDEIFASEGESGFRQIEKEVVLEELQRGTGVMALGGGAPGDPDVRRALKEHLVIFLDVPLEKALERVVGSSRPMLQRNDPEGLLTDRLPLYLECASVVISAGGEPEEVAGEVVIAARERVRVPLGDASYTVVVGSGVTASLPDEIVRLVEPSKVAIVTHPALAEMAKPIGHGLVTAGVDVETLFVPEGETAKSLEEAGRLLEAMASMRSNRGDAVVAVGGGVVTDLAGFVASVYARGISVVHVPTTLLGQVDAAIGGKTGVDLPQAKNMVGTFHQPRLVVCDVDLLDTLPQAEFVAGMAEVVKAGLIADPGLLEVLRSESSSILAREKGVLTRVIRRAVEIKAAVVAEDEREGGRRAILNYGHTFAHAIEVVQGLGNIRHGEAVSLGMMAAAHLAEVIGLAPGGLAETQREVLSRYGLPTSGRSNLDELSPVWQLDKKYSRGVRFVLLRDIGDPVSGVMVDDASLKEALERMSE